MCVRGILSQGIVPIIVTLEHDFKATFLRVHSSGSMENSFNASITISTCLGPSSKLKSCSGVNLFSSITPAIFEVKWGNIIIRGEKKRFCSCISDTYIVSNNLFDINKKTT